MVDVIVTITSGSKSSAEIARAVHRGGGLVGANSTVTPPESITLDFVDWPFLHAEPRITHHIERVREHRPKYVVAPDVEGDRYLEDVIDVADEIALYAENVIVIPKSVPVSHVPPRFIVGAPFRDEWDTDTGVNDYPDFRGRPVHILGGNHTEQIHLADRYDLQVTSADSPNLIRWAQGGRVWIAQLGGANEVEGLPENFIEREAAHTEGFPNLDEMVVTDQEEARVRDVVPDFPDQFEGDTIEEKVENRISTLKRIATRRRIEFSVRNLVQAWNDPMRRVSLLAAVEPGRGPPPPMDEPQFDPFEERMISVEEQRERFLEAAIEEEKGEVETTRGLVTFEDDED